MPQEVLEKESTLAIKQEGLGYGVNPTVASANVVRFKSVSNVVDDPEQIQVQEIRNTFDELVPLQGSIKPGFDVEINMRGASTAGTAPEGDPLYLGAFGAAHVSSATTVATDAGNSATTFKVASLTGLSVNDAIRVKRAASSVAEVVFIDSIDSINTKITVSPALGGIPANGDTIGAGYHYTLKKAVAAVTDAGSTTTGLVMATGMGALYDIGDKVLVTGIGVTWVTGITGDNLTVSPALASAPLASVAVTVLSSQLPSMFASYWIGDVTRADFWGLRVESMDMSIATGAVVSPKFSLKGIGVSRNIDAYTLGTPTFNTLDPYVGVNQSIVIGAASMPCEKFDFKLTNSLQDIMDVTTQGIQRRVRTARKIEGTFDALYKDNDIYAAVIAGTTFDSHLVISRDSLAAGKIVATRMKQLRYFKAPVNPQNGIFKNTINWQAQMNAGEDSLSTFSFI